jgi:hypothetical protein
VPEKPKQESDYKTKEKKLPYQLVKWKKKRRKKNLNLNPYQLLKRKPYL